MNVYTKSQDLGSVDTKTIIQTLGLAILGYAFAFLFLTFR